VLRLDATLPPVDVDDTVLVTVAPCKFQ